MKTLRLIVMLTVLLLFSSMLLAEEQIQMDQDIFTDPFERFLEGLDLNETQVEYIERYIVEFRGELHEKRTELLVATVNRRIAMVERSFDDAREFATEQAKIRGEISNLRINQFERLYLILTPEQREFLENSINEALNYDYETRDF